MDFGWLICKGRLILGKKCIILVSDNDDGRGYAWVGTQAIWQIYVHCSQFCDSKKAFQKGI